MPDYDYGEPVAAPENLIERITATGNFMKGLQDQADEYEVALNILKAQIKIIAEKNLPELMGRAGLNEFTTSAGVKIVLVDHLHASIKKENLPEAIRWLEENGHGAIVTQAFSHQFRKGEEELAKTVREALDRTGLDYQMNPSVHHSRLTALVKELRESDTPLPTDLLGIHEVRQAEMHFIEAKVPKKRAKK